MLTALSPVDPPRVLSRETVLMGAAPKPEPGGERPQSLVVSRVRVESAALVPAMPPPPSRAQGPPHRAGGGDHRHPPHGPLRAEVAAGAAQPEAAAPGRLDPVAAPPPRRSGRAAGGGGHQRRPPRGQDLLRGQPGPVAGGGAPLARAAAGGQPLPAGAGLGVRAHQTRLLLRAARAAQEGLPGALAGDRAVHLRPAPAGGRPPLQQAARARGRHASPTAWTACAGPTTTS